MVPPGSYTLELVAQDRESAAMSVHRVPLAVAPAQGLADPISKGATPKLPVDVVVSPVAGAGAPQMTLEFSADGKTEGRNGVMLPAPDPDGLIRFLAPIPIERFAPGRHELKVTGRQGSAPGRGEDRFHAAAVAALVSTHSRRRRLFSGRVQPFTVRMDPMRSAPDQAVYGGLNRPLQAIGIWSA